MRLNHECVRDTMLYLEENLQLNDTILSSNLKIKDYSNNDITYSVKMLLEAGLIQANSLSADNMLIYLVSSLTWEGHQYLDNIRDNSVWKIVKSKISKLKSVSLPIAQQIAVQAVCDKLGIS